MEVDTTLLTTMFNLFISLFSYVAPLSVVICLSYAIIKLFVRGVMGRF